MEKIRTEYHSSIDALVAISKRLSVQEKNHNMSSEDFYHKFSKGFLEDSVEFVEWANDYRHYLAIYKKIDKQLRNVA